MSEELEYEYNSNHARPVSTRSLKFRSMSFNWATLVNFELSAYAGATAAVDIQVKIPSSFSQETTTDLYPGGGSYTSPETLSFSM